MAGKKSGRSSKSGKNKAVNSSRDEKVITRKQTKSEIYTTIAESANLPKKDVKTVFEVLGRHITRNNRWCIRWRCYWWCGCKSNRELKIRFKKGRIRALFLNL